MLDLRATSSGGGTSLTAIGTILAGGDGQTVAGVPVANPSKGIPVLVGWGGITTAADTIKEIQLASLDLLDPTNNEDFTFGASSLVVQHHVWDNLPFVSAARVLKMAQNTGANNNIGYTVDYYPDNGIGVRFPSAQHDKYGLPANNWYGSTTYGGALTAITWKQQAFNPTTVLPAGRYAIQGAWVNALGAAFTGLLRFRHADFGIAAPGFPVLDQTNSAVARTNVNYDDIFQQNGYQFSALSSILKKPCEPVFTVSAQGTGLNFEMASITADTPIVTVNLAKVA